MSAYLKAIRCPIFGKIEATFFLPAAHRDQEGRGSTRGGIRAQYYQKIARKRILNRFRPCKFSCQNPSTKKKFGWMSVGKLFFPADVLPRKVKYFISDRRRQFMHIFPADVLSSSCRRPVEFLPTYCRVPADDLPRSC